MSVVTDRGVAMIRKLGGTQKGIWGPREMLDTNPAFLLRLCWGLKVVLKSKISFEKGHDTQV